MKHCELPNTVGTRPGGPPPSRVAASSVVFLLALTSSVASAQEVGYEVARAHFDRAQALYDAGSYALAADGFREAYDLMEDHPRRHLVLFNLARSLDESGASRQALARYREYLELSPADDPQRVTALERIPELERRVALSESGSGEDAGAPADQGGDGTLVVAGGAVLGGAAAGFVAMAIFGGLALAEDSRLRDGCGATASCSEAEVADADTFALVSDVSLGIAGAAAIAGGVLLIVGLVSGGGDERAAVVVPWVNPNGAGVVARVAF